MANHKTSIGGQALIEGIMMKGPNKTVMANRLPDGSIDVEDINSFNTKSLPRFLKLPFIRGPVNFVESMLLGYKCLLRSAEKAGIDDIEAETKFEKWLTKTFGDKLTKVVTYISMVLGILLSVLIFFFIPILITKPLGFLGNYRAVIEGLIRIAIFVIYMLVISKMNEIHRLFQYHGAEHKCIACYEAGDELTVENVRKHRRLHPRCGTSFIFLVLIISIVIGLFVTWDNIFIRLVLKIALLPVVASIAYELIKLAGRHENVCTKIISAPGLWLQYISTQEPEDDQIEVGIAALSAVIPESKEDDQW